ncbi:MAG: class I SAM-dependent methyltransferase [Sphingomonadales bacterium]
MRPDVLDLKAYYASALGPPTVNAIANTLPKFQKGERVLALGYGIPYLEALAHECSRAVAAMPARQGALIWQQEGGNQACLVDVDDLPFDDALFDHVLLIHCLEYSGQVGRSLEEAARVLSACGRLHVVVPNRVCPWSRVEATPFGNGRPFSSGQLQDLMHRAHLAAETWQMALMLPPWKIVTRWKDRAEPVGRRLWSKFGGVYVVSARKERFAGRLKAAQSAASAAPIRVPTFAPVPAARASTYQRLTTQR